MKRRTLIRCISLAPLATFLSCDRIRLKSATTNPSQPLCTGNLRQWKTELAAQ